TVQLGTASTTVSATVKSGGSPVNGATVNFAIINSANATIATTSGITGADGVATATINTTSYPIGVYAVKAIVGSGCDEAIGYLTIYDPNANFVTGGGWITSPEGAYV